MKLEFDVCYRAVQSRDARFDGRFFTAVTATGIYCRPICPARTPLRANVRFYVCAAAAEAAGFRACKRCRPEASPGSPEWDVRGDLVARALRLIADGAIDSERVSGLARRLNVCERHLHRELVSEIGAGPLALARTRRAQTARLLIDQTHMPLSNIALAAGFASIRQFNETMRASFGCNPSALRQRGPRTRAGNGDLILRLFYRPPFDEQSMLGHLADRVIPGVEEVMDGVYRRTLAVNGSRGTLELEPATDSPHVTLRLQFDDLSDLGTVVQRCRQLFDLDADPATINGVLQADPILAPLVEERPGLRVVGSVDGFQQAVRAVLGQQVSVAAATTLARRIVSRLGTPLAVPRGTLTHYFPTPEALMEGDLSGLGITGARIRTIKEISRAVAHDGLTLDRGVDREDTIERLTSLPGIGEWTAAYIAMRTLGDPDAFPATDLGLRQAVAMHGLPLDRAGLDERSQAWRPWRAYATHHLWASLPRRHARNEILKEKAS